MLATCRSARHHAVPRLITAGDNGEHDGYPAVMSSPRAEWPIRRYRLGEEPPDDLSQVTTAEQRLAMMWPLAREGWLLAGHALPTYGRANLPSRIFRRGERPNDE